MESSAASPGPPAPNPPRRLRRRPPFSEQRGPLDRGGLRLRRRRGSQSPKRGGALGAAEAPRRPDPRHGPHHRWSPQAARHPPAPLPLGAIRHEPPQGASPSPPPPARSPTSGGWRASTRSAGRSARPSSTATTSARSERRRTRPPAAGSSAASWRCAVATSLPEPEVNAIVGAHEVDFLWRERKLIVETDGWDAHSGRQAFEDDRAKDAELRVLGFTVSASPTGRSPSVGSGWRKRWALSSRRLAPYWRRRRRLEVRAGSLSRTRRPHICTTSARPSRMSRTRSSPSIPSSSRVFSVPDTVSGAAA